MQRHHLNLVECDEPMVKKGLSSQEIELLLFLGGSVVQLQFHFDTLTRFYKEFERLRT